VPRVPAGEGRISGRKRARAGCGGSDRGARRVRPEKRGLRMGRPSTVPTERSSADLGPRIRHNPAVPTDATDKEEGHTGRQHCSEMNWVLPLYFYPFHLSHLSVPTE
jgi:hypothetical protein